MLENNQFIKRSKYFDVYIRAISDGKPVIDLGTHYNVVTTSEKSLVLDLTSNITVVVSPSYTKSLSSLTPEFFGNLIKETLVDYVSYIRESEGEQSCCYYAPILKNWGLLNLLDDMNFIPGYALLKQDIPPMKTSNIIERKYQFMCSIEPVSKESILNGDVVIGVHQGAPCFKEDYRSMMYSFKNKKLFKLDPFFVSDDHWVHDYAINLDEIDIELNNPSQCNIALPSILKEYSVFFVASYDLTSFSAHKVNITSDALLTIYEGVPTVIIPKEINLFDDQALLQLKDYPLNKDSDKQKLHSDSTEYINWLPKALRANRLFRVVS